MSSGANAWPTSSTRVGLTIKRRLFARCLPIASLASGMSKHIPFGAANGQTTSGISPVSPRFVRMELLRGACWPSRSISGCPLRHHVAPPAITLEPGAASREALAL